MKFSRTSPVKVVLLGAGGTGGYIAPHLYRIASGAERPVQIVICDGDICEEKNLIRQNFVEQDIGRNKAAVLAQRYSAAFGVTCYYKPNYVESISQLYDLISPEYIRNPYHEFRLEAQRVVLIGAVDNNQSRKLCHEAFCQACDLIYIDAGNGKETGQVVCGVRQKWRTLFKPVASLYPDILQPEDKFPTELSCAERAVSAPQSIAANLMAATVVACYLYRLLIAGEIKTRSAVFSSTLIGVQPHIVTRRKSSSSKAT